MNGLSEERTCNEVIHKLIVMKNEKQIEQVEQMQVKSNYIIIKKTLEIKYNLFKGWTTGDV